MPIVMRSLRPLGNIPFFPCEKLGVKNLQQKEACLHGKKHLYKPKTDCFSLTYDLEGQHYS